MNQPARTYHPATRFHEDYRLGEKFWTPGRTVTEADVVIYAMVSGDWSPPHTDRAFAEEVSPWGRRIAHGMLTTTIVAGLLSGRLGYMDGTGIAFAGLEFDLTRPVYIGDTIHAEVEITQHKPSSSRPERGFMEWSITVLNQNDEVVATGSWKLIVARRTP